MQLDNMIKEKAAIQDAFEVLEHEMKWAILENLSTTTRIESCLFCVFDNPSIKSNSRLVKANKVHGGECKDRHVFVAWPVDKCVTDQ